MKRILIAMALCFFCAVPISSAQETLRWRDLIDHPERWPETTTLTSRLQFANRTLKQGTEVEVHKVFANEVELVAPGEFLFAVNKKGSTLLKDANVIWTALTPEQKALNWRAIQNDQSLWPPEVTITEPLRFDTGALNNGDTAKVITVRNGKIALMHPNFQTVLWVGPDETDIFTRARERLAIPKNERPGIMASLLGGSLTDPDGNPAKIDPAEYYVIYTAASTCPRCKIFTPKMAEYYKQNLAGRDDVAFVTFSTDLVHSDFFQYVKNHGVSWPIIKDEKNGYILEVWWKPGVSHEIPALIVLDKFGNVLFDTKSNVYQQVAIAENALLELDKILKDKGYKGDGHI